ncbi:MAG TPA: AraC family transcriptional regulator, partial [Sphingobacteriaceae bacterium]
MTELYIKNMVCQRCILVIREELAKLDLVPEKVELGYVVLEETLDDEKSARLSGSLTAHGFELLDNSRTRLIENIKNLIIRQIHHHDTVDLKVNWSDLLAGELHQDYNTLSTLFSSVEGITLEQYIIRQKIERVKELLFYDEL